MEHLLLMDEQGMLGSGYDIPLNSEGYSFRSNDPTVNIHVDPKRFTSLSIDEAGQLLTSLQEDYEATS